MFRLLEDLQFFHGSSSRTVLYLRTKMRVQAGALSGKRVNQDLSAPLLLSFLT